MENGVDFMPSLERLSASTSRTSSRSYIDVRMLHRVKGDKVKSRLVLRDIARTKAHPVDTYAATPTLSAFRLVLALASRGSQEVEAAGVPSPVVQGWDITQAFVHAEMDQWILREIPQSLDGVTFTAASGETIVLRAGELLWVCRALYAYRRSPQLRQNLLVRTLKSLGVTQSQIEPMLFHSKKDKAHVDDLLVVGPETFLNDVQAKMMKDIE